MNWQQAWTEFLNSNPRPANQDDLVGLAGIEGNGWLAEPNGRPYSFVLDVREDSLYLEQIDLNGEQQASWVAVTTWGAR